MHRPGAEVRQQQILNAAAICFARHGFHQTTMQQICAEAKLSPGSVYRYYTSKEELIGALIAEEQAEALALIAQAAQHSDPIAALSGLVHTALTAIDLPQAAAIDVEVAAEAGRNPAVAERIRATYLSCDGALSGLLRAGQAQGLIREDVDAEATATLLLSLFDGLTVRRALGLPFDIEALAPTIVTLLERLLRPGGER
jgi:TetR/AcrR family transcriptional regulator, repressor for uid operon